MNFNVNFNVLLRKYIGHPLVKKKTLIKYIIFMVTCAILWMKYSIHISRNFNSWGWVGAPTLISSRESEKN